MTNLSAEALRELKIAAEKAEKVAPGPWRVEADEDSGAGAMLIANGLEQYVGNYLARLYDEATADYIAAASPDVILSLLAERERLAKDAARYQWLRARFICANFDPADPDGLDLGDGVALIFLEPTSMSVSADLDATIDAALAAAGEE